MGPSHHAPDVQTVLPHLELLSMSVDIPTTFGHVISFQADVQRDVDEAEVIKALNGLPRIVVGQGSTRRPPGPSTSRIWAAVAAIDRKSTCGSRASPSRPGRCTPRLVSTWNPSRFRTPWTASARP